MAVKNGRDEAGDRSRGTGTGQGNGRAKAYDRPVCFDTGHCRVDHRGGAACQGAGHQQAIASTDIRDNGLHWTGENDPRENRALDWPEDTGSEALTLIELQAFVAQQVFRIAYQGGNAPILT